MKTQLMLVLLLAGSFGGFAQPKAEIVKTINQLLAKAIGGTNRILRKGTETTFTITANSFSIDEEMNFGVFTVGKTFASSDNAKEETTNKSQIQHWKGFKVSPEQNSTTLKSIYPVFEKRENEPDNDKNGIKYYCLAGDEEKLIVALMHLQSLYSKK
ncbi:hypothetical protein ASU31_11370 [Pedobacter ginsenosidimutans]|uniref:DUF4468 domain-containing protein n=1 Tax=Pedobacter ginsenosidimutans TaxID=687842 RepID=A0A0T5VQK1_9SPHI|nr:hypothetical protein [Pedobacter ginsenosidimutans]KRT16093.1 hypothetical protein ASU31_11370 [Pedobacter ginsenosidimutans]